MSDYNKLALFDCDGTLVDGQHLIVDAMDRAFAAEKLTPVSADAVRSIIGLSLVEAMERLLPDAGASYHAHMAEQYKTSFIAMRAEQADPIEPLYDGILESIHALDDAGYMLGVATGKSMRGLVRVLEHHDLRQKFITLQTADGHPSKPHPSMVETALAEAGSAPALCVVIGDTTYDMMMARSAGASALGVNWGYHDVADLSAAGAQHIATRCHDVPSLVEQMIEERSAA